MAVPGTSLPALYSYRRCPYAMRARMALRYSNIEIEIREIVLKQKPAHMLAVSPKGTVPVLVLHDGTAIDESLDIMQWALAQHDPENWLLNGDAEGGREAEALIVVNDRQFKPVLDRYKYAVRFPEKSVEVHRTEGESFLQQLDQRLQSQAYLLASRCTLADVAIFPFIRQFAMVDMAWFEQSSFAALRRWLAGLTESQLFQEIMQKYPVWIEP
jgi:glutathione S-transferase